MFKRIHLFIILFFSCNAFSQEKILHVEYEMVVAEGKSKTLSSVLEHYRGLSIFQWNDNVDNSENKISDTGEMTFYIEITDKIGTINKIDYTKDSIYTRSILLSDILLIKEPISEIKWEINGEKKQLGNFQVNKASCFFRGRNYIAWFTPEIPINAGPWKLNGLPGLILEVSEEKSMFYAIAREISYIDESSYKDNLHEGVNKVVTLKEYAELRGQIGQEIIGKILSKLPRTTIVTIDSIEEDFLEAILD